MPETPRGSIGFGAGQDQKCRFRNVTVKSIPSRELLYKSGLNNPAVLGDFGLGWNQLPYIFDGAKRARYAWTADIITGGRSLYYSTAGMEFVRGNIEASMLRSLARSDKPALLPGGVPPGREFERNPEDTMFNVLTVNYSLYLIMVFYDYWIYTGDDNFMSLYWDRIKACLAFIEEHANEQGLVEVEGMIGKFLTLQRCAKIARSSAIDDCATADLYTSLASRTSKAINSQLYNPTTGHYNITTNNYVFPIIALYNYTWLIMTGPYVIFLL